MVANVPPLVSGLRALILVDEPVRRPLKELSAIPLLELPILRRIPNPKVMLLDPV